MSSEDSSQLPLTDEDENESNAENENELDDEDSSADMLTLTESASVHPETKVQEEPATHSRKQSQRYSLRQSVHPPD